MDILKIELPYPPSVNHYYLHTTTGVIISAKGKSYRRDVSLLLHRYRGHCGADKRLQVIVNVYPPDKRKRDLDNICKATLDALQHARIFADDNQIDVLIIARKNEVPFGALKIEISACSLSE